jgi:iron(III) transport system permease protein
VPANWTLGNFRAGFAGGAGDALARSVLLALATAAIAAVLGGLAAGLARGRWRGPAAVAITIGYALPGSAIAIGVMIGYGRWLTGSLLIIGVAYLAKFWALGHRPFQAALDRLPAGLTASARLAGASHPTAVRTVLLPPLRPAACAAAGLVFIVAFHELTMSTILYGPDSETFAVVIMNQQDLGAVGATAALSLILTVPVLAVAGALAMLARRRPGMPDRPTIPDAPWRP